MSMKLRWILGVTIGVGLIAIVALLFHFRTPSHGRSVGVILPLTGDAAGYGKSMQRGIWLGLAQVDSSASVSLVLHFEDSQGDPKLALSAYRKLVDYYHVPAIVGPFTSSETFAVAPAAERDRVVILSTGASAPGITNAGDFIFRIVTSDLFDGDVVARFVSEKLNLKSVAVIYINNDYGVGVQETFLRRFKELGGRVLLAEGYSASDSDQRTLLTKVKSSRPDAMFIVGYKEMGKVIKQARELGIKCQILSTGLFEDPEILATAQTAADGVYYSYASFNPNSNTSIVKEFSIAFRNKYNSDPDILAALGYDAVRLIAHVYSDPSFRADQIRDRLYDVKDFPGAAGDMSFDRNGDVHKSFGIKRVQDGKFIWVVDRY